MLRSGAVYLLANIASSAVPFFLLPILTRALTPEAFGAVVGFFLVATLTAPLAGLNAHGAVGVAWFNRQRAGLPAYVGAALVVAAVSSVALAGVIGTAAGVTPLSQTVSPGWAMAAVVMAGAQIVVQMRLVLWQSQKRPVPVAIMQFGGSMLQIGLALTAVLWLELGADGRNGAAVVGALAMAAIALVALALEGEVSGRIHRGDIVAVVRFGGLLVPHAVGGVLMVTVDRVVVGARLGAAELGMYGAAAQLGTVVAVCADAFGKAYSPWLFERLKADRDEDRLVAVGAMYALIPIALVGGACAAVVMVLFSGAFLGPAYAAAAHLMPWFVAGGVATVIYLGVSPLFFFHERTGRLSATTLPAALAGAACTIALVLFGGTRGAAAGFALTQVLLTTSVWFVAVQTFAMPWTQPRRAFQAFWRALRPGGKEP